MLWEIAKREEGLVSIPEEVISGEVVLDFSDRFESDFDFEVLSLDFEASPQVMKLIIFAQKLFPGLAELLSLLSPLHLLMCPVIKIGSRILLDIYGKWEMKVLKLGNSTRINEQCLELQKYIKDDVSKMKFSTIMSSEKRVSAFAISNDGLFVCFADKFGVVWFVDLDGFHENQALASNKAEPILAHYCSIITSLEFSPDGRFIISADRDFKIRVTLFPKKPLDGAHEIQSFCLGQSDVCTSSLY
ncbi:unnamed protein product [Camellia sinensis]